MATMATLTINAEDIIGADFDRSRASVWVEANTPHGLIVVDGTNVRVGGRRENLVDGVATFNLVTTNSADNPTSFGYRVTITYVPKGSRKQGHDTITTSDFPFIASANLAAIPEAWDNVTIPVSWRSDFLAKAQALLEQQQDLAAIDDTDSAVAYAVASGTKTPLALAATYARPEVQRNRLAKFHQALGKGIGRILTVGDSWTERRGASGAWNAYPEVLASIVRDAIGGSVSSGIYIPAWSAYPDRLPAVWTYAGTTSQKTTSGPGYYNVELSNAATATLTFFGTGYRIHYDRRSDGATAVDVSVDGASVGTINSNGGAAYGQTHVVSGLAAGWHTLVLTVTTGTVFSLQGAYAFNGDDSTGIRVYAGGHTGWQSSALLNTAQNGMVGGVAPDLVLIEYGINDYRQNTSVATFKANIQTGINTILSASPGVSIGIISSPEPAHLSTPVAPWSSYKQAMAELAEANGAVLIDLTPVFGSGVTNVGNGLWDVDGVHTSNFGEVAWAHAVASAILPATLRPKVRPEQVRLHANRFVTVLGSTGAATHANNTYVVVDFIKADSRMTNVEIPAGWREVAIDLLYLNKTATGGNIRLRTITREIRVNQQLRSIGDAQAVFAVPAVVNQPTRVNVASGIAVYGGMDLCLQVTRMDDATDTLATGSLGFMGAVIRRTK